MDTKLVKQFLSQLNNESFKRFIYELWNLDNDNLQHKKLRYTRFDKNIIEEEYTKSEDGNLFHGYYLIIPFLFPIEVFDNANIDFLDPYFMSNLKKYKRTIKNREQSWFFPTDGNYIEPGFSFITNFEGIDTNIYYTNIIPKFEELVKKCGFNNNVYVGSCDSFFEPEYEEKALCAFQNFIKKYQGEISLSFFEGKINIEYFYPDKYISKGLLKNSINPYESISFNLKNKTDIILEFEDLINSKASESTLEKFLIKNYKEIFGEHYDRIESQIWLRFPEYDIANKERRIDLFLRNSIERDWELFEIKKPKQLTSTYRDIPVFKNEIYQAIEQIKNYEKILSQDRVKKKFYSEGLEYFYPELRLVIGNKPDISIEQWRWLKTQNENKLKIITYEDLISSMKIRYKQNLEIRSAIDESQCKSFI